MGYSFIINDRLNWIDWAKAIAISFVVFGHIPQEPGSFPQSYIVIFHMPFFFFISGYLTKKEYPNKETFKKYWYTLIIPYLCYNLVFYPYWLARQMIENPQTTYLDLFKPILGTILLQHETPLSVSLNGVTWFIAILLEYKIILTLCNKCKKGIFIIATLMIGSAVLYVVNEFYLFTKDLPPIGFMRCLPFFFIGYYCRQNGIIRTIPTKNDWYNSFIFLSLSIIVYFIPMNTDSMIVYAIRFWLISTTAIAGLFSLSKLLDKVRFTAITTISIGTIVIMGLHWMLIGTTNHVLEKLFCMQEKIVYPWYIACIIVIAFETLLYPIILIFKNRYPFMLGKKDNKTQYKLVKQ